MEPRATQADDLGRSYSALVREQGWEVEQRPVTADGNRRTEAAIPPSPMRILEALLFVGGSPLTAQRAGEIVRGFSAEQFTESIDTLNRAYRRQNRPYAIVAQDNGYVLKLRPKYNGMFEKLHAGPREARLSTPAIDVLALV